MRWYEIKQDNTRWDETKLDEIKQGKTRWDEERRWDETKLDEMRQNKTKLDEIVDEMIWDKTRQN